jgi:DNA-directed RNA polymerase subunit RPC12/RpoP
VQHIPYREFNCPHCGAPGCVSYGNASYTCTCRFRTFVSAEPPEASLVKAFQQSPRRVDSGVFSRPCSRCGKEVRSNDPVAISATVLYCSIECAD